MADHVGAARSQASIIDPPIGQVTIDLTSDDVVIRCSNGESDSVPRTMVTAIRRDECGLTVNWAGTPILLAFESPIESADMFGELGGFEMNGRSFTILVDPAPND